jgi:hypothetical protein
MLEREIRLVVKNARVVQRRAVVELIEGDDMVVVGICDDEMANEPAGAAPSLKRIQRLCLYLRHYVQTMRAHT